MASIKLVGYGKMAEAILAGILKHDAAKFDFHIIGRDLNKAQQLANKYQPQCQTKIMISDAGFNAQPLSLTENDILLLAIKPYALSYLKTVGSAPVLCSILAGIDIRQLSHHIQATSYVRAMPNIAASFGQSCTALYAETKHALIEDIFKACGQVLWLSNESKFDAAMALVGSAPAYLAMMAEALCDAGVREGLTREESQACVQGLFEGFPALLKHKHPALIKEEISSPAGVTIQGIATLESHSFRGIIIEAIHEVVSKVRKSH